MKTSNYFYIAYSQIYGMHRGMHTGGWSVLLSL